MNIIDSIILGIVQGLTEFVPISSSGHLLIIREMLGINVSGGLAYDSVLQLATTLAVIIYFAKDILRLVRSFFMIIFKKIGGRKLNAAQRTDATMIWAIIIATIPAVVFGLWLEDYMDTVFRDTILVAISLIVGAFIMIFAESFHRIIVRRGFDGDNFVSTKKALFIGLFQTLALIPGASRSGMTISGGLFAKISRDLAVRFSFLLAIPVLLGSGLKKLFEMIGAGALHQIGNELLVGAATSFIVGFLAIHFLIKFLKKHSLKPFAYYRIILAILILFFIA